MDGLVFLFRLEERCGNLLFVSVGGYWRTFCVYEDSEVMNVLITMLAS